MEIRKVNVAGLEIGGGTFTVLAGPCMAESREICMEVADFLRQACAKRGINYIFKASYDKANRSSGRSVRGPGLVKGLEYLSAVKAAYALPVVTDIHEPEQATEVADVADVLQIPAFLCRQTDLLEACARTGRPVNVKKGQFMAPEDMRGVVEKLQDAGAAGILLTERGSSFGYHNLVVDMRGLQIMRNFGVPVIFDATHSVQLPGGNGTTSGGQREFVQPLARAAAGVGIDGLFMEVHPDPAHALSDGPNSLNFAMAEETLDQVMAINEITRKFK